MTEPSKEVHAAPERASFYLLSFEVAQELRSYDLSAAEWRLWSYLATLDPFGNQYQELPDLISVLQECRISKPTFYRCLARFEDLGLFDTQPLKIAFRNLRGSKKLSSKDSLTHETFVSPMRQKSHARDKSLTDETIPSTEDDFGSLKPAQTGDVEKGACTNNRSNLLENNRTPAHHPVTGINREGIGTDALIDLVVDAGLSPNKTIRKVIGEAQNDLGPAAAARAVENALSALREQQAQGTVRNPGGFFTAALRRGFTANQAKRVARDRGDRPPAPPDRSQIEMACAQAHLRGDRGFIDHKLRDLCAAGWQDLAIDLSRTYPDWGVAPASLGAE